MRKTKTGQSETGFLARHWMRPPKSQLVRALDGQIWHAEVCYLFLSAVIGLLVLVVALLVLVLVLLVVLGRGRRTRRGLRRRSVRRIAPASRLCLLIHRQQGSMREPSERTKFQAAETDGSQNRKKVCGACANVCIAMQTPIFARLY